MVGIKGQRKQWGWVLGALIAIFVAVAMTTRTAPQISLFGRTNKPCHCDQVWFFHSGQSFVLGVLALNFWFNANFL